MEVSLIMVIPITNQILSKIREFREAHNARGPARIVLGQNELQTLISKASFEFPGSLEVNRNGEYNETRYYFVGIPIEADSNHSNLFLV